MTEEDQIGSQVGVLEPTWQNFSSMYREAICAQEATSGMEITHHRMAALYFGIATLECFINREMTRHDMLLDVDHAEIHQKLRSFKVSLMERLEAWPEIITGKRLLLRPDTLLKIKAINGLRGQLTHLKNYWPDTFDTLGQTDPMHVVELVAEYIVSFSQAKGEPFPYWVWGWNYLCPNRDGYQISPLPNTQVLHSLRVLGYTFQQQPSYGTDRRTEEILSGFSGYQRVASFLRSCGRCEPKWEVAPHQPKLCRRWWEPAHQKSCGAVTPEAIARALELDEERAHRMTTSKERPAPKPTPVAPTWAQRTAQLLKRWLK